MESQQTQNSNFWQRLFVKGDASMISVFNGVYPKYPQTVFIAPSADIIGQVSLGEESSVWFQTVIRGDINEISVGSKTNIQDGCLLHVTQKNPVFVGDCVTVGHGAILHGCHIENECLIAMGAIVLDGAFVESHCIIGAGCLIPPGMKIARGSLVLGNPGKIVRKLNEQDLLRIENGWKHYVAYSKSYLDAMPSI